MRSPPAPNGRRPVSQPATDLARRFVEAAQALAAAAVAHAAAQQTNVDHLIATLNLDNTAGKAALDEIWYHLAPIYTPLRAMESVWNELAARVADRCAASS
jgi:hypothetical protein